MKKFFALLLALVMVVSMLPMSAFAAEEEMTPAEKAEQAINDAEVLMAQYADLIAEYYDEAYAFGHAYASANGYIAEAQNAIDVAIAAVESIDLSGVAMTAEFQATVEVELAAVVATMEAAKVAVANAATVEDLTNAVFALENDLYAHLNNLDQMALQAGNDAYELVVLPVKNLVLEVNNAVETAIAAVVDHVTHITAGEVVLTDDFFYLAINDMFDFYAELVAAELNLTEEQFKMVTLDEVTVEDLARADMITIAYDDSKAINFTLFQMLGVANSYVEYADAFVQAVDAKMEANFPSLMEMLGVDIYDTVMEKAYEEYALLLFLVYGEEVTPLDWASLVGAENAAYIEESKAQLVTALNEAGMGYTYSFSLNVVEEAQKLIAEYTDNLVSVNEAELYAALGEHAVFSLEIPVAELVVFAAESAVYEYIRYNKQYSELVMTINAVNPDASVALLGSYNHYDFDIPFMVEEITFTLNDLLAAAGQTDLVLPAEVEAYLNTELTFGGKMMNVNDILAGLARLSSVHPMLYSMTMRNMFYVDVVAALEGGDEYIAAQILNGLTVNTPCEHAYDDCADAYCNLCGEERVAPGHSFVEGTCTACGAEDPDYTPDTPVVPNPPVIPPVHTHRIVAVPAVAATCTKTGLTAGEKCATCGEILTAQKETPALGHTEEVVPAVEATCGATGLTEGKKCSVCGEILVAQEETAALEHKYESVVTAPTCEAGGYTTHTCSVCGHSYKDSATAMREHKWDDGELVRVPTCTGLGTKKMYCVYDDCDAFTFDNLIAPLGHTEEVIPAVAATCTKTGLTEGKKCSVCGEILVAQETVATNDAHSYRVEVTKEATETEEGEKTYTCEICGDVRVEKTGKLQVTGKVESSEGNVKVEIDNNSTADIDPNTKLVVEEVNVETVIDTTTQTNIQQKVDTKAEVLAVYDITLMLNDVAVQPGGEVKVTIPAPAEAGKNDTLVVVYVDDNGNVAPCQTVRNADGTLTFVTDHFSYYAVVSVSSGNMGLIIGIVVAVCAAASAAFIFLKKKRA